MKRWIKRGFPTLLSINLVFSFSTFACEDESYRQFDFWLGQWEVTRPDGTAAGINHITQSLNGCAIIEHYKSVNGYEGNSINIYNQNAQQWHQTWVDNTGLLLQLDGGLVGNDMVLWGKGLDQTGRTVMHRITWSPTWSASPSSAQASTKPRQVTQKWQVSHDQGVSWQLLFEGIYTSVKQE